MVQLVVTGPRWRPKRTPACRYCGFRCAIRAKHPARYCRRGDRVLFCCTAVDVGPWPFADNVLCAANVRYGSKSRHNTMSAKMSASTY
jgi:hypothetical protein